MKIKIIFLSFFALITTGLMPAAGRNGYTSKKIERLKYDRDKVFEAIFKGDQEMLRAALTNKLVKSALNTSVLGKTAVVGGTVLEDVPALYTASVIGFAEGIALLVQAGAAFDAYGPGTCHNFAPLHYLARSHWLGNRTDEKIAADIELLVDVIKKSKINVNVRDGDGLTPLMYACRDGNVHSVKLLIACGADLELRNKAGSTALCLAAQGDPKGAAACVDLLLEAGAYVNRPGKNGLSALSTAAGLGRVDIVQRLLHEPSIDVNAADAIRKATPLYIAVQSAVASLNWSKEARACALILAADVRVDHTIVMNQGETALDCAKKNSADAELIGTLTQAYQRQAQLKCTDTLCASTSSSKSPLATTVSYTPKSTDSISEDGAHYLMQEFVNTSASVLEASISSEDEEVIPVSEVSDATSETREYFEKCSLEHEKLERNMEDAQALLTNLKIISDEALRRHEIRTQQDFVHTQQDHTKKLFEAVKLGDVARVQELLAAGVDPNSIDYSMGIKNYTPLYVAVYQDNAELAAVLLHAGANPLLLSGQQILNQDLTLLHLAAAQSGFDCLKLLLKAGIPINTVDKGVAGGWTALDYVCDQVGESIRLCDFDRFNRAKSCIDLLQRSGGVAYKFLVDDIKKKAYLPEMLIFRGSFIGNPL